MKTYEIPIRSTVTCSGYLEVEAESFHEAKKKAIADIEGGNSHWSTVLNSDINDETPVVTLSPSADDTCTDCGADLSAPCSVRREYVNKDDDEGSIFGSGHIDEEGNYEPDESTDLSSGRFDLAFDSDTCAVCGSSV